MTTHEMKLRKTPFMQMVRGEKTVECRLYDEKRREVALGDEIVFRLMDNPDETLTVKVIGLLRYATFGDMFARNDPQKFGGKSAASLTESLLGYYSLAEQETYGVLGIEFELVR